LTNTSEKMLRAGSVAELDVLKARLATGQTETDLGVGAKRVMRARQQLNILMGRASDGPISIAPLPSYTTRRAAGLAPATGKSDLLPDFDTVVPPLQNFIDRALANRLELHSLQMQQLVNNANLHGAWGNAIPDVNFAYGKSTAGNPSPGPKLTAVFMTLNAPVPISNWNQGAIYQYKATRTQLNYQILSERNQVMSDVSAAYNNLLSARKRIKVFQDRLLADSEEVARLSRRSYESGQADITSVLNAQQANVQTRSSYLDSINSYASAFADLEFAVGKPLQ
jgi:outer membrane protein TolC